MTQTETQSRSHYNRPTRNRRGPRELREGPVVGHGALATRAEIVAEKLRIAASVIDWLHLGTEACGSRIYREVAREHWDFATTCGGAVATCGGAHVGDAELTTAAKVIEACVERHEGGAFRLFAAGRFPAAHTALVERLAEALWRGGIPIVVGWGWSLACEAGERALCVQAASSRARLDEAAESHCSRAVAPGKGTCGAADLKSEISEVQP